MHGALAAAGALRQGNTCRGTARCCLLSQVGLPVHTVDRTATRGAGRHGLYRALRHVQRAFRPRLRGDGRRRHAPDSWRPGTFRHTGPSQNSPPPQPTPNCCLSQHPGSHHDGCWLSPRSAPGRICTARASPIAAHSTQHTSPTSPGQGPCHAWSAWVYASVDEHSVRAQIRWCSRAEKVCKVKQEGGIPGGR